MRMSYQQLLGYVDSVVTTAKLSISTFAETRDNTAGLLDKIGKIVTLDTNYEIDKLNMFDGEYLSFGKSIEEWSQDLIMIEDKDASGSGALAPHRPTYRPVFYSYTLGKKVIKTTIDYNDLERAVHFEAQFVELISMKYKRISDSMAQYRYAVKREMIAKLYAMAIASDLGIGGSASNEGVLGDVADPWSAVGVDAFSGFTLFEVDNTTTGATPSQYGKYLFVKNLASTSALTFAQIVAQGYAVKLDLVTEIAKPVDDTTGEAFIEQVKKDVEIASDSSEGHSLNGNTLGATEGLVLILKQGIMPNIEVNTWAGAFQENRVAFPTEVVVVKDFGSADDKVYGLLCDRRALRLHNTYNATRTNENGDGDFLNVFRHTEDTAYISRNAFIKFYKEA